MNRPAIAAAALIGAAFAASAIGYVYLPEGVRIPMHYDLAGHVTRYDSKGALFMLPAVAAIVWACLVAMPRVARLAPKGRPYPAAVAGVVMVALAAVFFVADSALVAHQFYPAFDILRATFMATGVMLVVVGNILGKLRANYVIGIRTRATLSDPTIWDKTHRFTGKLMFAGGLVLIALSIVVREPSALIAAVVTCAAGPLIAGAVYSRTLDKIV